MQRRRQMLEQIMPELESIYNLAKDKPSVRYFDYTNPDNLAFVRQEIEGLRASEMCNIFNWELFHEAMNRPHIQKILETVEKFKVLYIARNKIIDRRVITFLENPKLEIKYLSEAKFGFLCEVLIARDTVYIARQSDGLIIMDKLFSQTLKLVFQALWGIAEEIKN